MAEILIKCYLFYSIWEHFFEMLIRVTEMHEIEDFIKNRRFLAFHWEMQSIAHHLLYEINQKCWFHEIMRRKKEETFFLYIFLSLKEIMKCFAFHRENRRFSLYKTWIYDSCHKNIFDILIQRYLRYLCRTRLRLVLI